MTHQEVCLSSVTVPESLSNGHDAHEFDLEMDLLDAEKQVVWIAN